LGILVLSDKKNHSIKDGVYKPNGAHVLRHHFKVSKSTNLSNYMQTGVEILLHPGAAIDAKNNATQDEWLEFARAVWSKNDGEAGAAADGKDDGKSAPVPVNNKKAKTKQDFIEEANRLRIAEDQAKREANDARAAEARAKEDARLAMVEATRLREAVEAERKATEARKVTEAKQAEPPFDLGSIASVLPRASGNGKRNADAETHAEKRKRCKVLEKELLKTRLEIWLYDANNGDEESKALFDKNFHIRVRQIDEELEELRGTEPIDQERIDVLTND
jgi:hypothetical protein